MVRWPIDKAQTVAQYLITSLDLSLVDAGPRVLASSQMLRYPHGVSSARCQSRPGNAEQLRKNKGMPSLLLNMPRRSWLINQRVPRPR